jgi:beta-lactamase regulating signal transducer with metallopeptidase domain
VIDRLGHTLVTWLVAVNASTAILLAGAVLLDRALAHRTRASLRLVLYAPIALRVLLPLSWSIPVTRAPRLATLLPQLDATAAVSTPRLPFASVYGAMALAWAAIAAALLVRRIAARIRLARAIAECRAIPSPGAPCPVVSHRELGPMVAGTLSPRIVLPEVLLRPGSEDALAFVVRHEGAHVRRRDPWLLGAMQLLAAVAWPVIPVWLAIARVNRLVEIACDELALDGAGDAERRRYGHTLLDWAERGHLLATGSGGLHFGSTLRARVEALASCRRWPRALQACLVGAATVSFAACSSASPAPQASTSQAGETSADEPERLKPEAIQEVVRQNFGYFRVCYQNALKAQPNLRGRVTVAFTIDQDGSVLEPTDHGSDLPDPAVVQCVVRSFGYLSVPPPSGGQVTVIYPIQFDPGD